MISRLSQAYRKIISRVCIQQDIYLRISRETAPGKKITPSAQFIHKAFGLINSVHQELLPNE